MEWSQFLGLALIWLGGLKWIHGEFKEFSKEIRNDIKSQSERSDKLYQMFYHLLKEGKKK